MIGSRPGRVHSCCEATSCWCPLRARLPHFRCGPCTSWKRFMRTRLGTQPLENLGKSPASYQSQDPRGENSTFIVNRRTPRGVARRGRGDALDKCRRPVQLAIHGHRSHKDDARYADRRTLRTKGRELMQNRIGSVSAGVPAALSEVITLGRTRRSAASTCWPTSTDSAPAAAQPRRSTDRSNTSAAPPSGSATSPTTWPDRNSRPAASGRCYDLDYEEPSIDSPGCGRQSGTADQPSGTGCCSYGPQVLSIDFCTPPKRPGFRFVDGQNYKQDGSRPPPKDVEAEEHEHHAE